MEGRGFPRAGRAAPRDFPRPKPEGNPEEQPCQPEKNHVLPDSFTEIYILFPIGFRIGPPKLHRRFRNGLPKIHRQFHIGPPEIHRGSVLALLRLPSIFSCKNSTVGEFWSTMTIMKEKQQNFLFEI